MSGLNGSGDLGMKPVAHPALRYSVVVSMPDVDSEKKSDALRAKAEQQIQEHLVRLVVKVTGRSLWMKVQTCDWINALQMSLSVVYYGPDAAKTFEELAGRPHTSEDLLKVV